MSVKCRIGLYCGTSFLSRLIRWKTWGKWSHASILTPDFKIYESWTTGVRKVDDYRQDQTPGTVVHFFDVIGLTDEQSEKVIEFCNKQLGKKYDFWGIFGFLFRKKYESSNKWFCSELVYAAFKYAGVELLNDIEAYKVSPTHLSYSPFLIFSFGVEFG